MTKNCEALRPTLRDQPQHKTPLLPQHVRIKPANKRKRIAP